MAKRLKDVGQLTPDPENRRKHSTRGRKMLADALTEVGAARSIVIDENNRVLAGNGVLEAAADVGITKLQIVDAEGDAIIAVRRSNLNEEQKRKLAMYDNRTGELSEWVPEQLAEDLAAGADLAPFFSAGEQRKLLKTAPEKTVVAEVQTAVVQDRFWISIEGPLGQQAETLQQIRDVLAGVKDVIVELGTIPQEQWKP